ncbi:hypothetical protein SAY86_002951 [Trapa natans]|uniref:Uncharacterized protein n=1 Tax=Trapa natans TaxID=22666 RepID=A0AAN7LUJ9_TRANT|nr:hypothetical protein SAY86_002951 [Trapa natans]
MLYCFLRSNYCDGVNSTSTTSSTRMNTSFWGSRASCSTIPKSAQIMNRANGSIDWEIPHSTNRLSAVGANNKKCTTSAQSSSPPASQLSCQHQKTSRSRRTNLGPSISSNHEVSPLDTVLGILQHFSDNSPQLVKLKGDLLSSSTLSEGEDSGAGEIKSRDRFKGVLLQLGHFCRCMLRSLAMRKQESSLELLDLALAKQKGFLYLKDAWLLIPKEGSSINADDELRMGAYESPMNQKKNWSVMGTW